MFTFLKEYNTRSEKALLALVLIALCQETILSFPIAIINRYTGMGGDILLIGAYVILTVIALKNKMITRYIRGGDILLIAFFSFYVIVSYSLDSRQAFAISDTLFREILPCVPFLLFGLCLNIDHISMDALGKWSCLAVVLTSAYRMLYQNADVDWEYGYNMGAAYGLLANILITINYSFQAKKKFIPACCAILGALFLFAMGTRGPIFVMVAYLVICIFLFSNIKLFWKIILAIFILLIGAISTSAFFVFFNWLGQIISSMGLSTRVVELGLAEEMFSNTSGRDEIYDKLLSQMYNMPFMGYGVLGENRFNILSAHNLYLQCIFDYGYFWGGLILLFITFISLKSVIKTKGKIVQQWLFIWMVYVFVRGVFGGGVLRFEVFVLIGSCLRVLRMEKKAIQ